MSVIFKHLVRLLRWQPSLKTETLSTKGGQKTRNKGKESSGVFHITASNFPAADMDRTAFDSLAPIILQPVDWQ